MFFLGDLFLFESSKDFACYIKLTHCSKPGWSQIMGYRELIKIMILATLAASDLSFAVSWLQVLSYTLPFLLSCNYASVIDPKVPNLRHKRENSRTLIIGGEETAISNYPFFVGLTVEFKDEAYSCGGVIIKSNRNSLGSWDYSVLTAAHCVDYNHTLANQVTISLNKNPKIVGASSGELIVHEQFNVTTGEHDLALINFRDKKEKPESIKPEFESIDGPGALDEIPGDLMVPGASSDNRLLIMGTGSAKQCQNKGAGEPFRHGAVKYISNSLCSQLWGGGISDDMLCSEFSHSDDRVLPGEGDSGGPLLAWPFGEASPSLVGVISWGSCTDLPSGYARISAARDFIENNWVEGYEDKSAASVNVKSDRYWLPFVLGVLASSFVY